MFLNLWVFFFFSVECPIVSGIVVVGDRRPQMLDHRYFQLKFLSRARHALKCKLPLFVCLIVISCCLLIFPFLLTLSIFVNFLSISKILSSYIVRNLVA